MVAYVGCVWDLCSCAERDTDVTDAGVEKRAVPATRHILVLHVWRWARHACTQKQKSVSPSLKGLRNPSC
jgi:hypothetical protein